MVEERRELVGRFRWWSKASTSNATIRRLPAAPMRSSISARASPGRCRWRRLEQKDTVFTDVKGDRVAMGTAVDRTVRQGHGRLDRGRGLRGHAPRPPRRPSFGSPTSSSPISTCDGRSRAMSALAWRPGMPIGRVDLDAASVSGFGGEALARYGISLGSISTADQARGPATSSAPACVSRASCWRRRCAASRRCSCASACRRWA